MKEFSHTVHMFAPVSRVAVVGMTGPSDGVAVVLGVVAAVVVAVLGVYNI